MNIYELSCVMWLDGQRSFELLKLKRSHHRTMWSMDACALGQPPTQMFWHRRSMNSAFFLQPWHAADTPRVFSSLVICLIDHVSYSRLHASGAIHEYTKAAATATKAMVMRIGMRFIPPPDEALFAMGAALISSPFSFLVRNHLPRKEACTFAAASSCRFARRCSRESGATAVIDHVRK